MTMGTIFGLIVAFVAGAIWGPRLWDWVGDWLHGAFWGGLAVLAMSVPPSACAQAVDTTVVPVPYDSAGPVTHDTTVSVTHDTSYRVCCRDSLAITPRPTPPPIPLPPPTSGTQEPPGFQRLTSRSCDGLIEDGWTAPGNALFAIVTDPVQGKVCQTTYPAGFKDGRAPATIERVLASRPQQLYIRFRFAVSANFQAHVVWNKGFHGWVGGSNRAIVGTYGTGAAGSHVQNVTSAAGKPGPSVVLPGRAPYARLTWHTHEVLLTAGANGRVTYWLDGRLFLDAPVNWGTAGGWERISWSPTYGGNLSCRDASGQPINCTVPATMQVWWDDLYVSGR